MVQHIIIYTHIVHCLYYLLNHDNPALTWKHSDVTLSTLVKEFRMRVIDILGEAEIYTRYY